MIRHHSGTPNKRYQADAGNFPVSMRPALKIKLRQKERLPSSGLAQPSDYHHVLVVHHHSDTLEMITAIFRKCGFYVTTARNNSEALITLSQINVDLVFSDLDSPLLEGYHLAYLIKKLDLSTKIAAMTCRCQAEIADLMTEGTIDGWLFKPFKLKAFKELLIKMGLEPEAQYRQSKSQISQQKW